MTLDERLFIGIDLNAFLTFLIVYREQGVALAAKKLNVTQPAVSKTLKKLRARYNDPLFIRDGQRMLPTAKAAEIALHLEHALTEIQTVLAIAANSKQNSRTDL